MTELLPSGDKVSVSLASGEALNIASGKTAKVTILAVAGDVGTKEVEVTLNNDAILKDRSSSGEKAVSAKTTLHENDTIEAANAGFAKVKIRGWEFDYAQ